MNRKAMFQVKKEAGSVHPCSKLFSFDHYCFNSQFINQTVLFKYFVAYFFMVKMSKEVIKLQVENPDDPKPYLSSRLGSTSLATLVQI